MCLIRADAFYPVEGAVYIVSAKDGVYKGVSSQIQVFRSFNCLNAIEMAMDIIIFQTLIFKTLFFQSGTVPLMIVRKMHCFPKRNIEFWL